MAEPTAMVSAPLASGDSWWAALAASVTALLVTLGTPWVIVFWASVGAFFGAGLGPKNGRWKAIFGFPLCVLLAAKAGVVWTAWHGPVGTLNLEDTAEAAAVIWGLIFHPAIALLVNAVPVIGERWGVKTGGVS